MLICEYHALNNEKNICNAQILLSVVELQFAERTTCVRSRNYNLWSEALSLVHASTIYNSNNLLMFMEIKFLIRITYFNW